MPITIKHAPGATAVAWPAYLAGRGAYEQQQDEFTFKVKQQADQLAERQREFDEQAKLEQQQLAERQREFNVQARMRQMSEAREVALQQQQLMQRQWAMQAEEAQRAAYQQAVLQERAKEAEQQFLSEISKQQQQLELRRQGDRMQRWMSEYNALAEGTRKLTPAQREEVWSDFNTKWQGMFEPVIPIPAEEKSKLPPPKPYQTIDGRTLEIPYELDPKTGEPILSDFQKIPEVYIDVQTRIKELTGQIDAAAAKKQQETDLIKAKIAAREKETDELVAKRDQAKAAVDKIVWGREDAVDKAIAEYEEKKKEAEFKDEEIADPQEYFRAAAQKYDAMNFNALRRAREKLDEAEKTLEQHLRGTATTELPVAPAISDDDKEAIVSGGLPPAPVGEPSEPPESAREAAGVAPPPASPKEAPWTPESRQLPRIKRPYDEVGHTYGPYQTTVNFVQANKLIDQAAKVWEAAGIGKLDAGKRNVWLTWLSTAPYCETIEESWRVPRNSYYVRWSPSGTENDPTPSFVLVWRGPDPEPSQPGLVP